jgi:tetratricopeptide (TPR) repeat protein
MNPTKLTYKLFFLLLFFGTSFTFSQSKSLEKLLEWADNNVQNQTSFVIDSLESSALTKIQEKEHLDEALILDKLAFIYFFDLSNYNLALEKVNKIGELAKVSKNKKIEIIYLENKGMLFYESKTDVNKALSFFKKAYSISLSEKSNFHIEYILNNYGVALMNEGDLDHARKKFLKAIEYCQQLKNKEQESAVWNNLGVCYIIMQQTDSAEYCLKRSFSIALETKTKEDEANRAAYLGTFYQNNEQYDKALYYLNFAKTNISSLKTYYAKSFVFKSLSKTYERMKEFEKAIEYQKTYIQYRDSIDFTNFSKQLVSIEYNSKIKEIEKKNALESAKTKSERYTEKLWYTISLLFVIVLGVVAWTIVLRLRHKSKLSDIERIKVSLEKQKLELELESNEREVAAKSMFLLEKDNLISKVIKVLKSATAKLKPSDSVVIQEIIHELTHSLNNKSWEEFEFRFSKVHPHFYKNLEKEFPNLSSNEKKLAAFLFMNLSTKEISTITGQTIHSINVARTRLRKKLNIVNENITFHDFFTKFTSSDN